MRIGQLRIYWQGIKFTWKLKGKFGLIHNLQLFPKEIQRVGIRGECRSISFKEFYQKKMWRNPNPYLVRYSWWGFNIH